jgi:outer membrane lipoprotein SlyB
MKASKLILCAGLLGIAGAASAQTYGPGDEGRRFNDGTRVVCRNVEVQKNTRDPNRIAGTATGAVIGGLLGNQIGGGSGKKLATVGGAVAGGAAGRTIQGNRQIDNGDRVVEKQCERR